MKVGISKFLAGGLIIALTLVCGGMRASAQGPQSPSFTDFSSTTGLNLEGSAAQSGTVLRLTPNLQSQAGAAWFNTQQAVQNGFTTTFKFQLSNPSLSTPADGIAFVIQNSSGTQLPGDAGGGIGYAGITNSIAIEFDTFQNGYDPDANHVAVQSCGASANTADHSQSCTLGLISVPSPIFSAGAVHTVTITYTPPSCGDCTGSLQVNLDGQDLFTNPVQVDLSTIGLNNGAAFVGFTGATGGFDEDQDILSWTFQPYQVQVSQGTTTTVKYQNNAYTYQAKLNTGTPVSANVVPIPISEADCNALILRSYTGIQPRTPKCFVYKDAGGPGVDSSVLFELTCPGSPSNPRCDPFDAELGSSFNLSTLVGVNTVNLTDPFPGWLKGGDNGSDPNHPCAIPAMPTALFASNQVDFFQLVMSDPFTKGGSGGTGSCWVATYNQPDEVPPGITITSPTNTTYTQNQAVAASYTCTNPTSSNLPEDTSHKTGPYLAVVPALCTGPVASGSNIDTSTTGPHTFTVTAQDTGQNQASQSVVYTVVLAPADVAIAEIAPLTVKARGKITYTIGVGDLGPNNAPGVVAAASIPPGTTFVSASGNKEVCAIVNRRLSCTVTPLSCSHTTTSVSCTVGTIMPLSLSSLNGATMTVTVQLGNSATVAAGKTVKNLVAVSSTAPDPKPGNNSATWSTLVTH